MKSDHKHFNCSQDHELDYVSRRYDEKQRVRVRKFLKEKCKNGDIKYSTHDEVYDLIKTELKLTKSAKTPAERLIDSTRDAQR